MRLCARGASLPDEVVERAVKATPGVSASFLKELMRRAAQFALERDAVAIGRGDVESALEELLTRGGPINRKLLGAGGG